MRVVVEHVELGGIILGRVRQVSQWIFARDVGEERGGRRVGGCKNHGMGRRISRKWISVMIVIRGRKADSVWSYAEKGKSRMPPATSSMAQSCDRGGGAEANA